MHLSQTALLVILLPLYVKLFLTGLIAGHLGSFCACWLLSSTSSETNGAFGLLACRKCGRKFGFGQQLYNGLLPGRCSNCAARNVAWPLVAAWGSAMLFVVFGWFLISQECQTVTEVQPSRPLWEQRLPFHLLLLTLLLVVTITDLLDYSVPDAVVIPGTLLAIVLATLSGELQMIHIWVGWDADPVEMIKDGPYLPEWMKQHQHLHGLAWSIAGASTGAALSWIVRILAGAILGYPAVGFGDVTLMAMIGAFLGWQPTLCTLAIAPIAGILIGLAVRLLTGRNFVAFGPYLAFAAVVVLFTWRILWEQQLLRNIFSHWPTVVGLVFGSLAAMSLLLAALRILRSLPVDQLKT